MNATAKLRARTNTAARTANLPLYYRTLSGIIAAHVEAGRLVKTGDFLDRVGGSDLKDGQKSWFGRHVAKAYRAANGGDSVRVWSQHRTTGKWIHVLVYGAIDPALYAGLRTYKATQHLLADMYARCA
ncbi:hypothetical protein AB0J81_09185 [Streptomyces bobili]|uniref:hypothetical protein n=1 Tax=Streptomyces bobili TaxID=67280 RepID=UPI00341E23A6